MDLLQSVDPTSSGLSSTDPYRPSFFELAAQDQLRDLLKPALRYTLAILAQRNPRYLLRVVNRFDEVYALMMWAVERHYLKTWGSSFSENFYGLRRRRRPGVTRARSKAFGGARMDLSSGSALQGSEALRPREINWSLILLVGLPYVQAKLHDKWEAMGGSVEAAGGDLFGDEEEEGAGRGALAFNEAEASRIARLRALFAFCFRKGYPYAGAAYHLWMLSYNVAYLFDRTPYFRPWLQAMRVDIRRVGSEDYPPSPPLLPPNLPSPLRDPLRFSMALLRSSPFIFFEALKYALPASIFFFKFLEWWYSSDNPRRRRGGGGGAAMGGAGATGGAGAEGGGLPMFGPPKVVLPHPKGVAEKPTDKFKDPQVALTVVGLPAPEQRRGSPTSNSPSKTPSATMRKPLLHNSCPICGVSPTNNPALVGSGGYVCCYTCAHAHVEEHGTCPVTLVRLPRGTSDIRRVLA